MSSSNLTANTGIERYTSSQVTMLSNTPSSTLLSSTQADETSFEEVIVNSNDERTDMEELERRLDEMMNERVRQALQLQALRNQFNEHAPMFGYSFLPPATSALKYIGFTYWAFFVVRFICLTDMTLLICVLGSISLICMSCAFITEQHLFLWPFAFVSLLETLNSLLQFILILLLIVRCSGKLDMFMIDVMNHEDLFGNALLDEMQSWGGIMAVQFYICFKLIAFPIAFMTSAQVVRIFYNKEGILETQELNIHLHHRRMTELMNRLNAMRLAHPHTASSPPAQQIESVIPEPPPCVVQHVAQTMSEQEPTTSMSLPNVGRFRPNARSQKLSV